MKRFSLTLAALCVLAAPASASAKSPLEGRWKNGKMEIVIAPCGGRCAGPSSRHRPSSRRRRSTAAAHDLIGSRVIDNIQPAGAGAYKANVFVADRDMNARGTIHQLNPTV